MTTAHDMGWIAALVVVLLALASAVRWDLLHLWWRNLLKVEPPQTTSSPLAKRLPQMPQIPPQPHAAEAAHQAQRHKTAFHRSGRRG